MPTQEHLPPAIQTEAGAIITDLQNAGWAIVGSRYDEQHFGNWFVKLARDGRSIQLTKDRSQFMIDAPIEELKSVGLFKTFDNLPAFRQAVVAWAARPWA